MPFLLLGLFICVPLAEIAVFIMVGNAIGTIPTILTVIITAIIGSYLLHRQGLSAFMRTQEAMAAGKMPIESVVDGVYLLLAGAFLLTPGLITDGLGFLLFIPPVRHWLSRNAFKHMFKTVTVETVGPRGRSTQSSRSRSDGQGPIIDGEYEHVDPEAATAPDENRTKSSPWRQRK